MPPIKKKSREEKKFTQEDLKNALSAVKAGRSVYSAAKQFNVPKTTLLRRVTGKYNIDTKKGRKTNLSTEQEQYLVDWVLHVSKIGFPITKTQLLDSVQNLVKELKIPNDFTNGRPGRFWFEGFLRRHPTVSTRVSQNLIRSRAVVTEEKIRQWFAEVRNYLDEEQFSFVLNEPNRVFNCDESALFLSPKENSVLAGKGTKTVYSFVSNDEKECLTTLLTGNAAGTLAPSMVVYKYKRIPAIIAENMPKGWAIGTSESGWMTGETFFEYIANVFHPWLLENNIALPVILFLDGHASHLTLHLSKFCKANGIILVALIANSTHILQPLDVAFFHPLKLQWKKAVRDRRMQNNGEKIKKENFSKLLSAVLKDERHSQNLISGFRTCGLCPFDPNAVDYQKHLGSALEKVPRVIVSDTLSSNLENNYMNFVERNIEQEMLQQFKMNVGEWKGPIEDKSLYFFWKKTCGNDLVTSEYPVLGDITLQNNIDQILEENLNEILNDDANIMTNNYNRLTKTPIRNPPNIFEDSNWISNVEQENNMSFSEPTIATLPSITKKCQH